MGERCASAALTERARKTDAWAATRDDILEIDAANLTYPQYVARAEGAYLWDVDEKRYIDFVLGYGPVVVGHAHPEVNAAVVGELARGTCMSPLWSPRQVELTELLTSVIPGAEQAYLMRTGSDATAAAVRLARIFTGRSKVLKWGYNGWHDWTCPRPDGVPPAVQAETLYFRFNDRASVDEAYALHPDQIACVIMMTYEYERPDPGFLNYVKDVAHRNGSLFILDEMRSGFRIALGGAQQYFHVQADLSTFSKAMSNGYPISAIVGRRDVLDGLRRTHMSSTFYGNPAEMAAALTTISIIRDTNAPALLWELGEMFQSGLRKVVNETSLPAKVVGMPISPFLVFDDAESADLIKAAFYSGTLRCGVLLHPNHQWFLSTAHTSADIDHALSACADAATAAMSGARARRCQSEERTTQRRTR